MKEDDNNLNSSGELTDSLKAEILAWCRQILLARLNHKSPPPAPQALKSLKGGVFVTLKKFDQLRGCIGRFEFSCPLADSIQEMVLAAGFKDPRFEPLAASELKDLEITISVLTEPKPLADIADVVIGRDGLFLLHPHGRGVLLPVVAEEQGWSAIEFARHTAVKAGLNPNAWQDPQAQLLVFTAPAFTDKSPN
ncbi:MAG: AmmeMemoRadiSam system protein A [Deltaproteobacteria bacterium]|jgi:AmmeMemoRadiSam system protein A|nr:AmmeMemoRadiSam system protein A [Deltaproteobacteria bacterium]